MERTKQELLAEIDRLTAVLGIKEASANYLRKQNERLTADLAEYRQENRLLRHEIDWMRKQ